MTKLWRYFFPSNVGHVLVFAVHAFVEEAGAYAILL
jgi:hypothetical protein